MTPRPETTVCVPRVLGLVLCGVALPYAALSLLVRLDSWDEVREAVKMGVKQGDVARHFRVSVGTVSDVVNERRWMPEPAAVAP